MGFNVTVTPVVQEVEISANVTPYEVQVTANQDLIDYVNEAKQSADEAEASAISADNSADSALASATSATASANLATSSASSASNSASTATTQAGIATTKANEASQSATNALASEQASAISEANALQSEQNALASEQSALASANTATSQAGIATTKAGEASASASSALASQNSATASANTATTQAGIATTQASNALASANAAAASAASAAQVGTSTLLTGFSVGSNTAIAGTDTILQAFNKTQGQINARVSGTGTSGQVSFWNGASSQGGSNNFLWDDVNGRIRIGGGSDGGQTFQVTGNALISPLANTTGLTLSGYSLTGSSAVPAIDISGTWNTTGNANAIRVNITNTTSGSTSNLLNLQVGGAPIFLVRASSIGGIVSGGPISANGYGFGTGVVGIFTVNESNAYSSAGLAMQFSDALQNSSLSGYSYIFHSGQYVNRTYTSGTGGFVSIQRNFAPTSGTGILNVLNLQNTINQTGGANGITRGLYVNPTLTSAADWRSIEWSNNTGWGLYGSGTANNYLGGSLGIGSTSLTNYAFRIGKSISGNAASVGIGITSTISSDVTTSASIFYSLPSTQATTFTLNQLKHFEAGFLTLGSGSTITDQFGFLANNSLTGATNNYGFYGNIASGTGRWNLYMNGTASNYLRGNLLLNTTTDAGFLLDVNGTARFSNDVTIADTRNIILATGTGTKIGTATSQKLSLWNATPNVQPTNAIVASAFVANTSGIANDTATFGGYTIGQIVAALQRIGALA